MYCVLRTTMPNLQKKRLLIFEIFNIKECSFVLEPSIDTVSQPSNLDDENVLRKFPLSLICTHLLVKGRLVKCNTVCRTFPHITVLNHCLSISPFPEFIISDFSQLKVENHM